MHTSYRTCITDVGCVWMRIIQGCRVRFVPQKLEGSALRRRRGRDASAFGAKPLTTRGCGGASKAPQRGLGRSPSRQRILDHLRSHLVCFGSIHLSNYSFTEIYEKI